MNAPGVLRHSRAHRNAVRRIAAGKMYKWSVSAPVESLRLVNNGLWSVITDLPKDAKIINKEVREFGSELFAVFICNRRTLTPNHGVRVKLIGEVKK